MSSRTLRRKALATFGVAALSLATLVGATSSANAIDPGDWGNIDGDRAPSLTVHKFLNQDVPDGGTATEGNPETGPATDQFTDPVAGVVFTAYPLIKQGETTPLDVTIPATWDGLSTLAAGANCTAPTGYTLGTGIALPATDAAGMATVLLDLGVYQVCETSAPANIIETAAPFIVTLPLPFDGGWLYDVNTFPKNGSAEINKSITLQGSYGLGSSVLFPVTVDIPKVINPFTELAIVDALDANFHPNADGVADVGVASVTLDGIEMDAADYNVIVNGNTVRVELTASGLLLADANQGAPWVVTFDAIIDSVGTGEISNTAELIVNGKPPIPSPPVTTNWGPLEVIKRNVGTTGTTGVLRGAVFEVYNAVDPYATDCTTAEQTGAPISVNGETTFTSNASGVVSVAGLFVSDSKNPTVNNPTRCYVIKETAAPAGYVLPADPFTGVTVAFGDTATTVNADIENTQVGVPPLPLTGGAGTALLTALGLGAIAAAIVLMTAKRRKARETV